MNKKEAIKYLLERMTVNSTIEGITPESILEYGIDPKILEACKILNFTITANGTLYRNDKQSFIGEIVEKMYDSRQKYKNEMLEAKKRFENSKSIEDSNEVARLHNLQMAKKIQLNSLYGAIANKYCRWNNFYHAECITKSGQFSIRWIEKKMNEYMNKMLNFKDYDWVCAADTDSIYLELGNLVKTVKLDDDEKTVKVLDEFCESKIQPYIDKCFDDLSKYMNTFQQKMVMKRETIANKGIWKAKKMYILNAWNVEGVSYDKPKLKIHGIEAVRSSTPYICRKYIRESLEIIMNEDELELQKYISRIKEEYKKLSFDEIAFPRGVNNLQKYYDRKNIYVKGTPIHIKASLLYNDLLKKHELKNLQPIMSGDKIKYCYLKLPNKIQDTVISNLDNLPDELGLKQYIDYDKQFDKSFIEPLKSITTIIKWDYEKKLSLEDFFNV